MIRYWLVLWRQCLWRFSPQFRLGKSKYIHLKINGLMFYVNQTVITRIYRGKNVTWCLYTWYTRIIYILYIYVCVCVCLFCVCVCVCLCVVPFHTFCTGNKIVVDSWKFRIFGIHHMRWLTNFYDFRFKWTATTAIGIHPTKAWLSLMVNFKYAIWTCELFWRTMCNKILS